MNDPGGARVAVYIDFDNIVISRYDQVHGRGQFQRDKVRGFSGSDKSPAPELAEKVQSAHVHADYRGRPVSRAVDLVQLFPAAAYAKNGADIRLAVDAVEDMFRLPDLTHVVIVAGDSDYIALAQRCRRLGRYVVGVGVAGSTSRSLAAACDELVTYDALPGITPASEQAETQDPESTPPAKNTRQRKRAAAPDSEPEPEDPQRLATRLLERAMRLGQEKDDVDWLHSSAVKSQMKRMDPSFSEKALGYRSFSDFVKSREATAELDETNPVGLVGATPVLAH